MRYRSKAVRQFRVGGGGESCFRWTARGVIPAVLLASVFIAEAAEAPSRASAPRGWSSSIRVASAPIAR